MVSMSEIEWKTRSREFKEENCIFREKKREMETEDAGNSAVMDSNDDPTTKSVLRRYESLITVRNKAIKGKGVWYWTHLEPILAYDTETDTAKSVKLRCNLCESIFSASNPSRTASEHLKRGTCPNFSPISGTSSPVLSGRKRNSNTPVSYHISPLAVVDPRRFVRDNVIQQPLTLSGGKDDLNALAMLEDSVKKLKSPNFSPSLILNKNQIESCLNLFADWIYECCGAVSFSSVDHPKFRAFLEQVGLPPIDRQSLVGTRLDAKYREARNESERKISEAMFFQVSSEGWKVKDTVVKFTVNLPNGTSVFRRSVFTAASVNSKYAEEVMWETVMGICNGGNLQRCVGIVADRYKGKALRNLESRNPWMINLPCQLQGFINLIKDFQKELPIFKKVVENCSKIVNFINLKSRVRNVFHKYQLQELDHVRLLRVLPDWENAKNRNFGYVYSMLEDILSLVRVIQLTVLDEQYKIICTEDITAGQIAEMSADVGFWRQVEAIYSLIKLVRTMAQEIKEERPLIGQCLPLWNELKARLKGWCAKFSIDEDTVENLLAKRFKRNYHPAWSAAFILDPLYLLRDSSGKYLPPFKCLNHDQEKDIDKLITRLVSHDEAHIALMELMKWRSEGLDPIYAQAVQIKQQDPVTGKMKVVNPQSRRLVWETYLSEFKSLGKVAVRLIFLHATSCGFNCNFSFMNNIQNDRYTQIGMDRAQKLIFVAAHSKLERQDFSRDEEKDAEIFNFGEDDLLSDVFY